MPNAFVPAVLQDIAAAGRMASPKIPLGNFEELIVSVAIESEAGTVYPTVGFDFYDGSDSLIAGESNDIIVGEEYMIASGGGNDLVGAQMTKTRHSTLSDLGVVTLDADTNVLDHAGCVVVRLPMGQLGHMDPVPAAVQVLLTNPTGSVTKGFGMSIELGGLRTTTPPILGVVPEQAVQEDPGA